MMKNKRISVTPVTAAANNIATTQTPGAAGALTLAGALAVGGVIPQQTLAYYITQTSVGADSGRTLTITGTDANNVVQTEDLTAAGAGLTVVSANAYRSISSIVIDAAAAGAMTVGTRNTTACAISPTYPMDIYTPSHSLWVNISGTINYTVQKCGERINDPTAPTPNWITIGAFDGNTGDAQSTETDMIGAFRFLVNTYTNGATFAMSINPSRE